MFVWTFLLRITHTIISQSSADSSWITLYVCLFNNQRNNNNILIYFKYTPLAVHCNKCFAGTHPPICYWLQLMYGFKGYFIHVVYSLPVLHTVFLAHPPPNQSSPFLAWCSRSHSILYTTVPTFLCSATLLTLSSCIWPCAHQGTPVSSTAHRRHLPLSVPLTLLLVSTFPARTMLFQFCCQCSRACALVFPRSVWIPRTLTTFHPPPPPARLATSLWISAHLSWMMWHVVLISVCLAFCHV